MQKKLILFILSILLLGLAAGCTQGPIAQITTPVPNTAVGTPVPTGQINVPGVIIQVNAPGPNSLMNTADANGRVAGILMGIWHGIISPVTLVISFIQPGSQMYEVHNDGSQYNFGYLIGVALIFLILGASVGSRRR